MFVANTDLLRRAAAETTLADMIENQHRFELGVASEIGRAGHASEESVLRSASKTVEKLRRTTSVEGSEDIVVDITRPLPAGREVVHIDLSLAQNVYAWLKTVRMVHNFGARYRLRLEVTQLALILAVVAAELSIIVPRLLGQPDFWYGWNTRAVATGATLILAMTVVSLGLSLVHGTTIQGQRGRQLRALKRAEGRILVVLLALESRPLEDVNVSAKQRKLEQEDVRRLRASLEAVRYTTSAVQLEPALTLLGVPLDSTALKGVLTALATGLTFVARVAIDSTSNED